MALRQPDFFLLFTKIILSIYAIKLFYVIFRDAREVFLLFFLSGFSFRPCFSSFSSRHFVFVLKKQWNAMKCFKKQQSTGSAGRTAPAFIRGVRCVMGVEPIILFIILFGVHFHASVLHIVLSNFNFHQIYLTLFFELIDNYFLISITIDPHLLYNLVCIRKISLAIDKLPNSI